MTKKVSTKRALLMSALSLLLCISMLVGSTFAWFTDSVTSGNNIIKSGNLDVELYHSNNYVTDEAVEGLTDLFTVAEGEEFLWEPGAVLWENFTVANKGSLALKYQLALLFTNATENADGNTLADVLKVAVVAGGFNGTREQAQQLAYNYSLNTFALKGELEANAADDVYGIVIYWEPSADDNDYNVAGGMSIDLNVILDATQLAAESDSFGPDYDVETTLPALPSNGSSAANIKSDGSASVEVDAAPSANTNKTIIEAPAGTFKSTDRVDVTVDAVNSLFNITANGSVVASLDINLYVNGVKTSMDLEDGKVFKVTTYVSTGLDLNGVAYTGTDKAQPTFESYDPVTGKLVFTTSHFSEYTVNGSGLAYDIATDSALTTIEQVVEASKAENNTVVIPEENQAAIEQEIEKLPEEEKQAAAAATAAAKIGEKTYATLAEAFAAAEDGDTIVVLNNVALSQMITNNKVITLDLNGKTIACTDTTEKNFSFIDNRGTLTVTGNGKITVTATVNSGWNRYSAVIANNPGGKLVIENGTIQHLGGTDMAYGIDNLTNGKGTYAETVINGGLIKSPYRAVRQFLNGVEANNILTVNGGTLDGANKAIFFHDPSAKANSGKLTVSENATLNGDVYLFVTVGSAEWPVDVSIAASAVSGEVKSGNVPAGYRVAIEDGVWTVLNDVTVVSTGDELVAALEGGEATYIQFKDNIKIDPASMSNAYGATGINIKNGQTLDGNGYTLDVKGAGGTWDSGINTTGGVIKNIKVTGSFRGIFINHNSMHSETVVLENVTLEGVTYTISCDQGLNQNLVATNCTFNGWTSFAATIGEVEFVNCNFGPGSGYNFSRPYAPTTYVGCTFAEGHLMDPRAAVSFEDCNLNGVAITAENFGNLIYQNQDKVTVK